MRYLSLGLNPGLFDPEGHLLARQLSYFAAEDVTIISFDVGTSQLIERGSLRAFRTGGRTKLQALWRGYRFACKTIRPDVVQAQDGGPIGFVAWFISRRFQSAFYLQDHSGVFARRAFGWKEVLFRPLTGFLFRSAARVRVVSERAKRGMIRIGVAPEKISVFPIRSDVSVFASIVHVPTEEPLVVCVARLEREKGVEALLKAFSLLSVTAKLCIVGDGSLRAFLERQAVIMKIRDRVSFVGKKSSEGIREIFSSAWVYVQPSFFEGWGMAVIEAAASGLPIVMSDVGCAGELLKNEESALIVHPGDVIGITRAIERVLQDPELAERIGARAKQVALALPGVEEGIEEMRRWLRS